MSVQGVVQVQYPGSNEWRPTALGQTFCLGDRVRVQDESRAALELSNDTILRLDQKTTLLLPEAAVEDNFWVELFEGGLYLLSRIRRSLEIRTPFVNAGLEGTEFVVRVLDDRAIVSVLEGRVAVSNALGRLSLTPGQTASATRDSPPVLRLDVRPEDAVHWALYYPLIVDPDLQGVDRRVVEAQRALAVGRADRAGAQLDAALAANPSDARALALASITALVQNATDRATELAERAVTAAPADSSARLALSYARQARFDLPGAKSAVDAALASRPDDAVAWARLAELQASLGDTQAAVAAAQRAVEIAPDLSRTQSVLGFVALTRLELDQAAAAFEVAIARDASDPLPRVGQALVRIRRGELAEGRRDLEIAVSLDPSNSLIRSYLGKAYFEERRDALAAVEFANAKALDPLDPTPWLYDAILKQSTNRPVQAARDLQRSIELNDNRLVYRSRLLLDEDAAARTANLAAIYRDLGLEELAITEAAQSLDRDPTNASAHWLLADSYTRLPRHEVAQVSESLQAQLWSPLNSRPLRPSSSEVTRLGMDPGGALTPSPNEYSALFQTDGIQAQADLVFGNNGTDGFELAAGMLKGPTALGAGAYLYDTDGFRSNDDYRQEAQQLFARVDPSAGTSIQARYSYNEFEAGDVGLYIDDRGYSESLRLAGKQQRQLVALRHALSLNHQLAFSFVHAREEGSRTQTSDFQPLPGADLKLDIESEARGYGLDMQYQYRGDAFRAIVGIGYSDQDTEVSIARALLFGGMEIPQETVLDDGPIRHRNAYLYAPLELTDAATVVIGGSVDDFDDQAAGYSRQQFNPKLGVTWSPNARTKLRAAAFRSLKRPLLANQSLEPTQIAGFNQLFDDANGTDAWRFGIGADHAFSDAWKAGLSLSWRDLSEPAAGDAGSSERDRDEVLHNAYLSWVPSETLTISVRYLFDRETREYTSGQEDFVSPVRRSDHVLPISISWFDPLGWFANLTGTYVTQEADFTTEDGIQSADTAFALADLSVGYRLPKRRGLVALEVDNLFDRDFSYHDVRSLQSTGQPRLPRYSPDRGVYLRIRLAF